MTDRLQTARSVIAAGAIALSLVVIVPGIAAQAADDGGLEIRAAAGLGFDDNAFLAPRDSYVDQLTGQFVVPERLSGFFVPVELSLDYLSSGARAAFFVTLDADAEIYFQTDTDQADERNAVLEGGRRWVLRRSGRRENVLSVAGRLRSTKRVYVDRDTGIPRTVLGIDASARYSYDAVGLHLRYEHETARRADWTVDARWEDRSYADVPGVPSLDHGYFRLALDVEIPLSKTLDLDLGGRYRLRDYDVYPARNAQGSLLGGNPPRKYGYRSVRAALDWNIGDAWSARAGVRLLRRSDDYVGYEDYDYIGWSGEVTHRMSRHRFGLRLLRWNRDYGNAFIFNLPVDPGTGLPNPGKHYRTWDVRARWRCDVTETLRLRVEYRKKDQETADPRYGYRRDVVFALLSWKR